jgi:hypothetical protein
MVSSIGETTTTDAEASLPPVMVRLVAHQAFVLAGTISHGAPSRLS